MAYRCVTENGVDGRVICIGNDENQGTQPYNQEGIWCDFTFEIIPSPSFEFYEWLQENNYNQSLLKVVDNQVVLYTMEELSS